MEWQPSVGQIMCNGPVPPVPPINWISYPVMILQQTEAITFVIQRTPFPELIESLQQLQFIRVR